MTLSKYAHKKAVEKFLSKYTDVAINHVLSGDVELERHLSREHFDPEAAQKRADVLLPLKTPSPSVVAPILTPAPITRPKPLGTIGDLVHL
jgi:hypothetical protein